MVNRVFRRVRRPSGLFFADQPTRHYFDVLEQRVNPAYSLIDTTVWVEQGPGVAINGQVEGMTSQTNPVAGAVEAVLPHPTDPNILLAGTVNGGIWKTTNATALQPTWTPRSDLLPSLSISALAYSPLDPMIVYAGTGSRSSNASSGGTPVGIYKSTDGGDTWSVVSVTTGSFLNTVRNIVPTTLSGGNVVLAGMMTSGVWRSTNGGVNWTQISGTGGLPTGSAQFLIGDSAFPNRFYAYIQSTGLYRSDDGGLTWTLKPGITVSTRADIAIHNSPGNNVLWVATCGGSLTGIFRSTNGGDTWTSHGTPSPTIHPGGQGSIHLSFAADPSNPNVVFVGGDRQNAPFPNSLGANNYSGIFFRLDTSSGSSFSSVTNNGANGTSPHADSRDLMFDANGNMILGSDGGVYRLLNPNTPATRRWEGVIGNMRNFELHGASYDNLSNVYFGGTQDTGTPEQLSADNLIWRDVTQGDGGFTIVDNITSSSFSYRYTSYYNLQSFRRRRYDAAGNLTETVFPALTGMGSTQFYTPVILNRFNGARILFGGSTNLYESTNYGSTVTSISAPGSAINAMAYGGRSGGVDNPDVIYFGAGSTLRRRTTAGGSFTVLSAYTGGTIRDIALDPDDWNRVFVVSSAGGVFYSSNAGASFTNITGNLGSFINNLESVWVYSPTGVAGDNVVVVAGRGGVFRTINPTNGTGTRWFPMGPSQYHNARTRDVVYDAVDDLLYAAAQGRGVFSIANASNTLRARLVIDGDDVVNNNDAIRIALDASDPNMVHVYFNSVTPTFTTYMSVITGIDVNGLGGNDTLILDFTNGSPIPTGGVFFNGGTGTDKIQVVGNAASYSLSNTSLVTAGEPLVSLLSVEQADWSAVGFPSAVNVFTLLSSWTGNAVLNGGAGNDVYNVNFVGSGTTTTTVTDSGGVDTINVFGLPTADTFSVGASSVVRGSESVNFDATIENVLVDGGAGTDVFNVVPSTSATFTIEGRGPAPPAIATGDYLNLNLGGVTTPTMSPTGVGAGSWTFGNRLPVHFAAIERMTPGITISGRVFNDLNGNGNDDGGTDPDMIGVTVELDSGVDGIVDLTTTSGAGGYVFTDLAPGNYRIRQVVPGGYTQTTADPADIAFGAPLNNPGRSFGNFSAPSDTTPPYVTGVYFAGSSWSSAFRAAAGSPNYGYPAQVGAGQLVPMPWVNVDIVYFQFSEDVVITTASLQIRGVNVPTYTISLSNYDSVNFVAEFAVAGGFGTDWMILDLDGDGGNAVTDPAGNTLAGTWNEGSSTFPTAGSAAVDFRYRFKFAVGDADRNGLVRNADVNLIRANLFVDVGQLGYSIFADLDGNGLIRNADVNIARARLFADPPGGAGPSRPVRGAALDSSRSNRITTARYLAAPTPSAEGSSMPRRAFPPLVEETLDELFTEG